PGLVLARWRVACVHASARGEERPARDTDEWNAQGHRADDRRQELEWSLLYRRKATGIPPREGRSDRSLLNGSGRCLNGRFAEKRDQAHPRRGNRRREPAGLGFVTAVAAAGPVPGSGPRARLPVRFAPRP